jgi:hypothetical protein
MTYPMLGDGANDFSRSKGNWEILPHYFLICTGETAITIKELSLSPAKHGITAIWNVCFGSDPPTQRKCDNPHMLPHGGTKWGNKFEPVTFRLDKKSRHRRFIPRKKEPKKNA